MMLIIRRNWAFRLCIILGVCLLLYICAHCATYGTWIDDNHWDQMGTDSAQQPHNLMVAVGNIAKITNFNQTTSATQISSSSSSLISSSSSLPKGSSVDKIKQQKDKKITDNTSKSVNEIKDKHIKSLPAPLPQPQPMIPLLMTAIEQLQKELDKNNNNNRTLSDIIKCNEKTLELRIAQRGDYWVLYNYVPMSIKLKCWESVTYTTHADFTFLDNLEPLIKRWQSPVSIALHAPGTDFPPTIDSIRYLRSCGSELIKKFTSFHIYFSSKHVPKNVPSNKKFVEGGYNCSLGPPWKNPNFINTKMYKNERKLLYPVNVGRNIARESAITHYVLASDIELYPNPPNLPKYFLEMIRKNDDPLFVLNKNPRVFVLPIFEVEKNSQPPLNKTALIKMLKGGKAVPFHKKLCSICHNIPKSREWQEAPIVNDTSLHIFHSGKRVGTFAHWEPIFIGTNADPLYEERLSWEGKSDKMTQGYALCVLDYDFFILDNAFLVHRPGIKYYKKDPRRDILTEKTNALIRKIIMPELKIMYGWRKGCVI